jgi:hypothetical protein
MRLSKSKLADNSFVIVSMVPIQGPGGNSLVCPLVICFLPAKPVFTHQLFGFLFTRLDLSGSHAGLEVG